MLGFKGFDRISTWSTALPDMDMSMFAILKVDMSRKMICIKSILQPISTQIAVGRKNAGPRVFLMLPMPGSIYKQHTCVYI